MFDSYNKDQKLNHAKRQEEKYSRLAKYSLHEDNKKRYKARAIEWGQKVKELTTSKDRLGIFTNNNKNDPKYYDFEGKNVSTVENELSQLDYEVGVIFDNGKAISCQLGIEDEVKFTKHQLKLMKGKDVTHNHPLSTPPSPDDLYILKSTKAKSFRTCGKNGTYVLEYSKEVEELPDFEIFDEKYSQILEELLPKYANKQGLIDNEDALIRLGNEVWEKLYEIYGVKPVFKRS